MIVIKQFFVDISVERQIKPASARQVKDDH